MRTLPFADGLATTPVALIDTQRAVTRALFVDLAGVLLDDAPPARMAGPGVGLRGGAGAALRLLDRLDYRLVILAPCTLDRRRAAQLQPARLAELLSRERIGLAGICRCGATGSTCVDCPPAPALLLHAARDYGVAMAASWLLAGSARYLDAGRLAGCRTILVADGAAAPPDHPERHDSGPGPGSGPVPGPAAYRSRDIVDAALAIVRMDGA